MKSIPTILFILLIGCKSSTENISSGDLLPLHEGNQWVYQTTFYNDSLPAIITQDTSTIIGNSMKDGVNFYEMRKNRIIDFLSNQREGLWSVDTSTQKILLAYEYPSYPGNEYIAEYDTSSTDSSKTISEIRVNLLSTNEQVITPAGNFNCYHYHCESEQVYFRINAIFQSVSITNYEQLKDIYFAPNIGIVKITVPRHIGIDSNNFRMTSVLKEYILK